MRHGPITTSHDPKSSEGLLLNEQIVEFLIVLARRLVYAAVCAVLVIWVLAVFGLDADWWHTYGLTMFLAGTRTLLFGPDWLR